jgi:hypothetical protein
MLNFDLLNAILPQVIMQSDIILDVYLLCVSLHCSILLTDAMQNAFMLRAIMSSVFTLSAIMLSVVMVSFITLGVVVLSVDVLSVIVLSVLVANCELEKIRIIFKSKKNGADQHISSFMITGGAA